MAALKGDPSTLGLPVSDVAGAGAGSAARVPAVES